jgi:hypothetical protein
VRDWRAHTNYLGFVESDSTIQWFWQLVETLTQEEKSLLLKFATGMLPRTACRTRKAVYM